MGSKKQTTAKQTSVEPSEEKVVDGHDGTISKEKVDGGGKEDMEIDNTDTNSTNVIHDDNSDAKSDEEEAESSATFEDSAERAVSNGADGANGDIDANVGDDEAADGNSKESEESHSKDSADEKDAKDGAANDGDKNSEDGESDEGSMEKANSIDSIDSTADDAADGREASDGKDAAKITHSEESSSETDESAKPDVEMEDSTNDDGKGNDDDKSKDDDSDDKEDATADKEENDVMEDSDDKDDNEDEEEEEQEELWDLKVILSAKDIAKSRATPCSNDHCKLIACSIWASNLDPESPWYSCLDCQENDFGGWPEEKGEIPLKFMGEDLRKVIVERCTEQEDPVMPDLPTGAEKVEKGGGKESPRGKGKERPKEKGKGSPKEKGKESPKEKGKESPTEKGKESSKGKGKESPKQGKNSKKDDKKEEDSTNESGDDDEDDNNANDSNDANSPASSTHPEEEEVEEAWDLKIVFSTKDLLKPKPVMCGNEGCNLLACCAYVSTLDPENPWFGCIDCQESEFGGWPQEKSEFPIKFLSEENRKVMAEKCSEQEDPAMPDLPLALPLLSTAGKDEDGSGEKDDKFATITPPPEHEQAVVESQSDVVVAMARSGKGKSTKSSVTPSPMPPPGTAPKPNASQSAQAAQPPPAPKPAAPPSKAALAMHQKWQAEAEKVGGPGARIVVSKPAAKKIIFDMLHDSFRPMNITEIHTKLKSTVPPPILKSSLDDMVDIDRGNPFDDDSDGESDDEKSSKKSNKPKKASTNSTSDEYTGSLRVKEGRNANNILYYVNYTKLQNHGNGLLPEDKNELYSNVEKSKCELEALTQNLKQITSETTRLLSEPTNEELATELDQQEKEMQEINEELEASRAHASNEKYAKQLKKRVDGMAAIWRKRKRMCTEFLMLMEDSTEGTISMKKCLNGDGQIDLESDESAIKGAMAFAKKKKMNVAGVGRGGMHNKLQRGNEGKSGLVPDERLIGVKLGSQGKPERVYLDGE